MCGIVHADAAQLPAIVLNLPPPDPSESRRSSCSAGCALSVSAPVQQEGTWHDLRPLRLARRPTRPRDQQRNR
jgi:hypothetical protein